MSSLENLKRNLPICTETGLFVESYITDYYTDWQPEMPKGWIEFDDRVSDEPKDEYMKRSEEIRVRRIGPRNKVLEVSASTI